MLNQALFYHANQLFATVTVRGVDIFEIRFAEDTFIFAADKISTEALLWVIEAISSE